MLTDSFRSNRRLFRKASLSPAQPQHAKTRPSAGKAAGSDQRQFFQAFLISLPGMGAD